MQITDDTNTIVPILGIPLATMLMNELNAFANTANVPGAALLGPLLLNENVTVVIKNSGDTATKGTRVTVNTAQTGVAAEFVESVIFELTNASNSAGFSTIDRNLKAGTISLRGYGRAKADLEAQASWNLVQIMSARIGYVPSAFGNGHIVAVNGANLANFTALFRNQPHDANAAATNVMSLPTEQMYAYNGAVMLASNNSYLNAALGNPQDRRSGVPKNIYVAKLKGALGVNLVATVSTQQPKSAARFYWTLVEAFRQPPAQVTAPWPNGGIGEWEFTPAMQVIAPDNVDPWQPKIAGWLLHKNQSIYTQ